jgi:tRNA G18 (ribose-2'-O)-methylase SpoU
MILDLKFTMKNGTTIQKEQIGVILLDIRSRENVGSIFRTADAAGVSKLYLCGITPRPPHEKISKTALGAEDHVAWEYHAQAWRLLKQLKEKGCEIIFLEQTSSSKNIFIFAEKFSQNWKKGGPRTEVTERKNSSKILSKKTESFLMVPEVVLVVGNEVTGIPKNLFNYASHAVEIPMKGSKESLNVAVAFGVAVYALTSQKA